jgi:hypothetical protein
MAEGRDRKIEQWKFDEEIQEAAWQEVAWNFWGIVREKLRIGF